MTTEEDKSKVEGLDAGLYMKKGMSEKALKDDHCEHCDGCTPWRV